MVAPLLLFPAAAPETFAFDKDAGEDLRPAAGGGAEVDDAGDVAEEVELFVELDELEGGAGAPALFFGEAVVGVSFVFGGFAHSKIYFHRVSGPVVGRYRNGIIEVKTTSGIRFLRPEISGFRGSISSYASMPLHNARDRPAKPTIAIDSAMVTNIQRPFESESGSPYLLSH